MTRSEINLDEKKNESFVLIMMNSFDSSTQIYSNLRNYNEKKKNILIDFY